MKKSIVLLMVGILLTACVAMGEAMQSTTEQGDIQQKLDQENAHYTDEVVDGGWGVASNPAITDEIKALFDKAVNGIVGVNYVPVTYLGMQVVAGYSHAILCQATTVYPGAAPRWVIMYLFEDLEGGVTISNIVDLSW